MAAALTIAALFAVSFAVVRISAVAMRLTGLPESVARFQCISALTGAGFTTTESEMIVNYPVRRRILVVLMVVGNLGIASVGATLIVSFISTEPRPGAFAWQVAMMALAVGAIVFVMTNKTMDRAMCGVIGVVLTKTTRLGTRRFHRVLQIGNGFSISEHTYRGATPTILKHLHPSRHHLIVLAIHAPAKHQGDQISETTAISPDDVLVCYGADAAHDTFADELSHGSP